MTTTRKSRRPARKPARRNASCRAACGMSRKNPTTYARRVQFPYPGPMRAPFNRLTPRDWAHIRETAASMAAAYENEPMEETVMTSEGYVDVNYDEASGAYAYAKGLMVDQSDWPSAPRRRASTKRSKRAVGSTRAKRTRKVNQRSNPGFAAGTPVWARINGRLYKATVLSTFGARARVAVIDPYSGRESIRETAVSHLQARPASRSNPRGDDREVTIYEVIYDGHGAGAAGDGTHIARFKSASEAARFAANHTAWGRPTKADAAKVPVRLARRWGVM